MDSKFLSWNWNDLKKGAIVAAVAGGLIAIQPAFASGMLTLATLKAFGVGAGSGLIAYLLKNLVTNSEGKILTKEPPKKNGNPAS